jgi:mono/diheme cytochrome c family protein
MMPIAVALFMTTTAVLAQHAEMMGHDQTGAMSVADPRARLSFPPPLQAHFLANMREHIQTIDAILQALAVADFDQASRVAKDNLGVDSPSAAGCKSSDAPAVGGAAKPSDSMDAMMQLYMPEPMRRVGLAMHTAASEFARVALEAKQHHDTTRAIAALAAVTQNCVACHSAYRVR